MNNLFLKKIGSVLFVAINLNSNLRKGLDSRLTTHEPSLEIHKSLSNKPSFPYYNHIKPTDCRDNRLWNFDFHETISTNSFIYAISSVQSLSHVRLFTTSWIAARQASLSINSRSSPRLGVHWVSDAILPSHPLSPPSPPAPNPSQQQSLFQWVKPSHEVAKVLEFQL